jgi:hypothetical protein
VNPEEVVQRQLEAYNAHDLARFIAEYSDDVQVFRPPLAEPVLSGKQAFSAFYAAKRFTLPHLHARVSSRIVCGNKVADHEHVTGLQDREVQVLVVYEVVDDLIKTVWLHSA